MFMVLYKFKYNVYNDQKKNKKAVSGFWLENIYFDGYCLCLNKI